jgi:hypothetical protein
MKLPRITIRRMMLLIAFLALALAGAAETSRYMKLAKNHRQTAEMWEFLESSRLSTAEIKDGLADSAAEIAVDYEGRLKQAAASSPQTEYDRKFMVVAKEMAFP